MAATAAAMTRRLVATAVFSLLLLEGSHCEAAMLVSQQLASHAFNLLSCHSPIFTPAVALHMRLDGSDSDPSDVDSRSRLRSADGINADKKAETGPPRSETLMQKINDGMD
eukprot:6010874-Pleurochrysis_carterae.AAC.4